MRRGFLIGLIVLWAGTARAQHLAEWMTVSVEDEAVITKATSDMRTFTETLREPGPATQHHLSKIFRKVHATYLKKYEAYADFQALLSDGKYDCLTATMLFSEVLADLQYDFTVVETNYHIFIQVQTEEGPVLLESTDRSGGFVIDPAEIARRTEGYRRLDPLVSDPSQVGYRFQYELYREVSPEYLTGLLYFNMAVKAYNRGDWLNCARYLEEGDLRHATDRCLELSDILIRTLVTRKEISPELRRASMEHLLPLILRRSGKVAVGGMD